MNQIELEEFARKRVKIKRGLAVHIALYLGINAMLIGFWALMGGGYPWFLWVVLGWGVGVVANLIAAAFDLLMPEEQAIDREMKRLQH